MINVLYITFASTNFDGATYSLMDLIRSVREYVNPLVLLRTEGCVCDYFKENGVECIDLYALTEGHGEYFMDGVHPNSYGNRVIAGEIHRYLTQNKGQ